MTGKGDRFADGKADRWEVNPWGAGDCVPSASDSIYGPGLPEYRAWLPDRRITAMLDVQYGANLRTWD
jgi:hypothetical protein